MDLSDILWNFQSATGSKRPSPSPGAEERENKKVRTEPLNETPDHQAADHSRSLQWLEQANASAQDFTSIDRNPPGTSFGELTTSFGNQLYNHPANGLNNFNFGGVEIRHPYEMQWEPEATENNAYRYPSNIEQEHATADPYASGQFEQPFQEMTWANNSWMRELPYTMHDNPGLPSSQNSFPSDNDVSMIQDDKSFPNDAPVIEAHTGGSPERPLIRRAEEVCNDYDTCFGVVKATPTSIERVRGKGSYSVPVDLKLCGSIYLLHDLSSDLHVDAMLLISDINSANEPGKHHVKRQATVDPTRNHSLRITVHGLKRDKDSIGRLFGDAGLFLQHPFADEIRPGIEYDNPHYLRSPGAQMPKLEQLSFESMDEDSSHGMLDDELSKSRWLRVFDDAGADADVTVVNTLVSRRLRSELMSHQITALAMMQEKERGCIKGPKFPPLWQLEPVRGEQVEQYRHQITGTLERRPVPAMGGVLADDMGLGKTLSILALICSSLDGCSPSNSESLGVDGKQRGKPHGTLIVAPKSTLYGWETQISEHIKEGEIKYIVYHGPGRGALATNFAEKDIVITTYETLRSEWGAPGDVRPIFSWIWLRVILDEAHHIRNRSAQAFKSVCDLKSRFRWCLTGTPIHNSLDDYGALLSFIKVHPFEQKANFTSWIVNPLQMEKAGEASVERLQRLIRATCLRRLKEKCLSSNDLKLPRRFEVVNEVRLSEADQILYDNIKKLAKEAAAGLEKQSVGGTPIRNKKINILPLINALRLVCNHGKQLLPDSVEKMMSTGFVPYTSPHVNHSYVGKCSSCEGELDETVLDLSEPSLICINCLESEEGLQRSGQRPKVKSEEIMPLKTQGKEGKPGPGNGSYKPSAKVLALLQNLGLEKMTAGTNGKSRKSVVFSYWTKMLDLVGQALHTEGIEFQRIDGQTSLQGRQKAMKDFNDDPHCTVMLASIGSAAEGLNLISASAVHLMEPQWNPMIEAQAVDRVYRIGQTQEVTVFRYVVPGSVENYVRLVQKRKTAIINKSINMDTEMAKDLEDQTWEVVSTIPF